jgi:hypothetical protein
MPFKTAPIEFKLQIICPRLYRIEVGHPVSQTNILRMPLDQYLGHRNS